MSRKIYNDLGNPLHCGLDLISERARQLGVRVELLPGGKDLTSATERAIYQQREFTLKFTHNMRLRDGSFWGSGQTVDFTFTLPPHAQARMDWRCVTLDEVKRAFMLNLRRMEKAWNKGDFEEYRKYANPILSNSEKNPKINIGSKHDPRSGGDYIALVVEAPAALYPWADPNDPRKCRIPASYKGIKVLVKTIWADGRTPLTRRELAKKECVITLEDNGFTLTKKAGMLRRAGRSDFSIRVSSKTNWLPFVSPRKDTLLKKFPDEREANAQIQDPKHSQDLMVSFDFGEYKDFLNDSPSETDKNMASEFGNAVGAWVRENLVLARGRRYARNSKTFFQDGFKLEHLGVEYTLKPNTVTGSGHFNLELDFDLDNMKGSGAEKVITTAEETQTGAFIRGYSLLVCYLKLEKMKVGEDRNLKYMSGVNRKCIDMLKDDYIIVDENDERHDLVKMARKIASIYVRNKRG